MRTAFRTVLIASCAAQAFAAGCASAQTSPAPADSAAAAAAADAAVTATDEAASDDSSEIVVTAQKRAQTLRDVPIAITVVSGDQLARQQINSVGDLKRIAPALEFGAPGQSPGGGAFIRGLGTTITAGSAEPSTGIVIDGVPQGNLPLLNLFDVERVEVLRGPQGTLFGQSVSAGVINITTAAPQIGEFSGRFRTEVSGDGVAGSNYGRIVNQLALNVPINDRGALRIAAHYDDVNGIGRNVTLGKDSDNQDFGFHARLLVNLTDRLTLNLSGEYNRTVANNVPFFTYRDTNSATLLGVLSTCGVAIGNSNSNWCSPTPDRSVESLYGFSAQADLDLGGMTLTSITAYRMLDNTTLRTIDHLPTTSFASPFPNITFGPTPRDSEQFSQELRLSSRSGAKLEWVAGLFYSHFQSKYDYLSTLRLVFLPSPIVTSYLQEPTTESIAGFAQGTYRVTDTFRLIAGGRLTRNDVSAQNRVSGVVYRNSRAVTDFSWKLGGQYDLFPHSTLYATVSEGFKGQTFDDSTTPAQVPVYIKPEIPTAYEIGLKGSVMGGRIGYDLNAFYVDVKNYQVQICVADPLRGQTCTPQNIDKVQSKGFEIAAYGKLFPGLTFSSGLSYTHATFPSGYLGQDGISLGGKQLLNSPRWKGVISGEYTARLSDTLNGFFSADGTYKSRVRFDASGTDRVTFAPHWITGARIGVRTADEKWEFSLFAKNLFNVHEPLLLYNSQIGAADATATTPAQVTTAQILGEASFRLVGASAQLRF